MISEKDKYNTIVHLWTAGPFMDDSTYQETMLANSNKKRHEKVYIVTTNIIYNLDGTMKLCRCGHYKNSHGVDIIRLNTHKNDLKSRHNIVGIYNQLCELNPDFIMNHVFNPTSCLAIHFFKHRNPRCKIVADSHMTLSNSFGEKLSLKEILICGIMRLTGLLCYKDIEKFYGISKQTVDMMIKLYGVPKDRAEYLPLGYDSDNIDFGLSSEFRKKLISSKGISGDNLVFITGGKLSPEKKTYELVSVFKSMEDASLVVFGEFSDSDYENRVKHEAGENTFFLGTLRQKQIYEYYLASDVAVFPGSPSCLRQEAVACGLPIIMACNEGDENINIVINSNGIILNRNWSREELEDSLKRMLRDYHIYRNRAMELANGKYTEYSYDVQSEFILYN